MSRPLILALDYGGSKLTAATVHIGDSTWLRMARRQSPPDHDAAYEQATMLDMAKSLLGGRRPSAIGVSFGGPVLQSAGLVILSHHIAGWERTPLAAQLASALGAPTAVANDANAGALGEWRFGAGQGCQSLLYVTVSTGIGGGWVLNGSIYDGADGMAGEIGHVVVNPGGALCVCGKRGCLEAEACGPAIARAARARLDMAERERSLLLALAGGSAESITAAHVAQAARDGDDVAVAALEHGARMLGVGLGGAINLMNPERVIIGGGVSKAGEHWQRIVRETARAHALPEIRVAIQTAALGDDAPLWGAVALVESKVQSPLPCLQSTT